MFIIRYTFVMFFCIALTAIVCNKAADKEDGLLPVINIISVVKTTRVIELAALDAQGKLYGTVEGEQKEDTDGIYFYISNLRVQLPEHRGKGLGTRLMKAMLQAIKDTNFYTRASVIAVPLYFEDEKIIEKTIKFYTNLGGIIKKDCFLDDKLIGAEVSFDMKSVY